MFAIALMLFIGASAIWIGWAPPAAGAIRRPRSARAALLTALGLLLIVAGIAGGMIAVLLFALNGQQGEAFFGGDYHPGAEVAHTLGWGILASFISLATLAGGAQTIRNARYPAHRPNRRGRPPFCALR